jgi:hypothetical protein
MMSNLARFFEPVLTDILRRFGVTKATAFLFLITLSLPSLWAQQPAFHTEMFHGRHAYVLDNGLIRVSLLRGGGHIAEIRFLSDDPKKSVNPMRIPHYQTIEPYEYDPAKHDALFTDGSHRWLSSGYMGHLLCFPTFGPPSSEDEVRNQLGNHGEAPIVEWKQQKFEVNKEGVTLWYGADLPKTQYRVARKVTLPAGATSLYVEEWVENLLLFDRPINWVQHATFGPPLAEPGHCFLDVSATRGEVDEEVSESEHDSLKPGSAIEWPSGYDPSGQPISLRPFQSAPHSGTYFALLLDQKRPQSYFTMYHDKFPVLVGYLFPTVDYPWLGDFQENQRITEVPWDGKVVTRGIEFGTTPFPEGLKKSVERERMFGVPTYRWIGGKQRLKTNFIVFLAEVPVGFAGVSDVTSEAGSVLVEEKGSGKKIRVATGKP